MDQNGGQKYTFGKFEIDLAQSLLFHESDPVKLSKKTFELLSFFVTHPNEVIEKETLMRELWGDTAVEEANLTVQVSTLRKVLGNGDEPSAVIETFPKVGYRFNANVEIAIENNGSHAVDVNQPEPQISKKRRSPYVGWIAILALAIILASLAYVAYKATNSVVAGLPVITRLNGFEQVTSYAISPDGQYAAQVINRNDKYGLSMVHLGSNSRIELVPGGDVSLSGLKFSADGNYLFFARSIGNGKYALFRTPILSAEPVKVLDEVAIHFAVSPTGDRIAYVRSVGPKAAEIVIGRVDGTETRTVAKRKGEENYWPWSIDWSPDGRMIAVSIDAGGPDPHSRLVAIDPETGDETPLSGPAWGKGGGEGLAWLRDGSGLIFSAGALGPDGRAQLWHISYPGGAVRRLTNDVGQYAGPYVTNDGRIMSAQWEDVSRVWISEPPFESSIPLTSLYKHEFNWIRTDSVGRIVFGSSGLGTRDIWVMEPDGTGERQLTQQAANNVMPALSADGSFVVYCSNRSVKEKYNLWRTDLGTGEAKQLTEGSGEMQPTVSPDGKWVFYTSGPLGGPPLERTLWRVSADGGEPIRITDGPAYGAGVSPDGKFVAAWFKPDEGSWKLAVFAADGGPPVRLFDAPQGVPVKWTPDGKAIAYLKGAKGVQNVWKQPFAGGDPIKVTNFSSMRTLNFDWTAADRIVCTRSERSTNVVLVSNFR